MIPLEEARAHILSACSVLEPVEVALDVRGPHREPVHPRGREGRDVHLGHHVGGQDAAERLLQVEPKRGQGLDPLEDRGPNLLEGPHGAAAMVVVPRGVRAGFVQARLGVLRQGTIAGWRISHSGRHAYSSFFR